MDKQRKYEQCMRILRWAPLPLWFFYFWGNGYCGYNSVQAISIIACWTRTCMGYHGLSGPLAFLCSGQLWPGVRSHRGHSWQPCDNWSTWPWYRWGSGGSVPLILSDFSCFLSSTSPSSAVGGGKGCGYPWKKIIIIYDHSYSHCLTGQE